MAIIDPLPAHRRFAASCFNDCRTLIAVLMLICTCGIIAAAEPTYQALPVKPEDKVQLTERNDEIHIEIQSATGIGRIKLTSTRKKAPWPKRIVLSITTADGSPLPELEGLTIQGKTLRIRGSRKTSGKMEIQSAPNSDPDPNKTAEVLVQRTKEALQILIPGPFLEKEPSLTIQWVDYYR